MPETKLTKIQVATELLDRALAYYLDEQAYVPAIVFAGSAEDIFHGYLMRSGRQPARANVAIISARVAPTLTTEQLPSQEELEAHFRKAMRRPFNWLRHANDPADPDEAMFDLPMEAEWVIARAITDMQHLLGDWPDRTAEFEEAKRARQPT